VPSKTAEVGTVFIASAVDMQSWWRPIPPVNEGATGDEGLRPYLRFMVFQRDGWGSADAINTVPTAVLYI
jgi:hypothetical protein